MEKWDSTLGKKQYRYILASLFLVFFLLTMMVAIRSQEVPNENQEADTHSAGGQSMLTVINEYFEILAVLLEVGIVILLWKTVKDFAELAKVSKLQTEVRFRPWVGPSGGFEFLREDNDKKQYSIAMKNFGEVPASDVIVTSTILDTKPDRSALLGSSKSNGANVFHIGPLLPGMEKRYWIFIENERYRETIEGTSNLFIFLYFSYVYSGGKSGYGMISQLDNKTNNFVHREMWID
ncbi:MAG TPA: hypothetical protein VFR61_08740 [Nitrososphaeraceae archaeon]|nr:hypothetical protein [Nitrososphaeraceae archaeon]